MKRLGFVIQDSHGRWLIKGNAREGYYWDNTCRIGCVFKPKDFQQAWKMADQMSHGIIGGLSIFAWDQGPVENIRTLKHAKYIYWHQSGSLLSNMLRFDAVAGPYHPSTITGCSTSFWQIVIAGVQHQRVFKGEIHDILVPYTPKAQWYTKRWEEHRRITGSIAP